MAFVIMRADGRFEVRESISTPAGPRARTLATFRRLSDGVLDHAEARARRPFDRCAVADRAAALGAPCESGPAARAGWDLVGRLASGERLPASLHAALAQQLDGPPRPLPDSIPPVLEWLGTGLQERGAALRDLLRVTDRLPPRPERSGRPFPRIASSSR